MHMMQRKILVVTIATGKYSDYFIKNLPGWRRAFENLGEVTFQVLTDRPPEEFKELKPGVALSFQEQLDWPDITLLRYEILLKKVDFDCFDVVVWLDADMDAVGKVPSELVSSGEIVMARHPGYELPHLKSTGISWGRKILRVADIVRNANTGSTSLGDWESRRDSQAYVARKARKIYVHGAVWLGPSGKLKDMCNLLADRTALDTKNGIVAKWHDESHLNWFAANHRVRLANFGFSDWVEALNFGSRPAVFMSQDKAELDTIILAATGSEAG